MLDVLVSVIQIVLSYFSLSLYGNRALWVEGGAVHSDHTIFLEEPRFEWRHPTYVTPTILYQVCSPKATYHLDHPMRKGCFPVPILCEDRWRMVLGRLQSCTPTIPTVRSETTLRRVASLNRPSSIDSVISEVFSLKWAKYDRMLCETISSNIQFVQVRATIAHWKTLPEWYVRIDSLLCSI